MCGLAPHGARLSVGMDHSLIILGVMLYCVDKYRCNLPGETGNLPVEPR